RALVEIAPELPEGSLKDALRVVQQLHSNEAEVIAFKGLAPYLSEDLLADAFLGPKHLDSSIVLTPYFSTVLAQRVLDEIDLFTDIARPEIIDALAPSLADRSLPMALYQAQRTGIEYYATRVLIDLIPYLSKFALADVLQRTIKIAINI